MRSRKLESVARLLFFLVCTAQLAIVVHGDGLGASNESAVCVQIEREIRALIVNTDQAQNGVEGGVLVANDCKKLVLANVMSYRSEEDQKALCENSCFATINDKYKTLLENDCFASSDTDEAATGNLQAAAYQIACQTTAKGKYCIPMLATLVANAGTGYDLCADIVKDMGCCFQSYKMYMKFGTPASIKTMDSIQDTCTNAGAKDIDKVCPCGSSNAYNKYAFDGTTICSDASRTFRAGSFALLLSMVWWLLAT